MNKRTRQRSLDWFSGVYLQEIVVAIGGNPRNSPFNQSTRRTTSTLNKQMLLQIDSYGSARPYEVTANNHW